MFMLSSPVDGLQRLLGAADEAQEGQGQLVPSYIVSSSRVGLMLMRTFSITVITVMIAQ